MSLLLEALKKAEKDKRGGAATPAPPRPLELALQDEPSPVLSAPSVPLPAPPPAHQYAPGGAEDRLAAEKLFSAKQAGRESGLRQNSKKIWFVGGGVLAAIFMSGGYYVWYELSRPAGIVFTPGMAQPAVSRASGVAGGTRPTQAEMTGDATPTHPIKSAPDAAAASAGKTRPTKPAPDTRAVKSAASPAAVAPAFEIRRQPASNAVAPLLAQAYAAYSGGRLDAARRDYQQHLNHDANSRDALLGLAAINAREGRASEAREIYVRVLELNPKDAAAIAGLMGLGIQADPTSSESRLKTLLAQQPNSPPLYFALGNLYAAEQRWGDAQQAYFRAHSIEAGNADYAFNLAVSLDHLQQFKLAQQYYRKAVVLAGQGAVGFDRAAAEKRIAELSK